jgi:hypothetical protein
MTQKYGLQSRPRTLSLLEVVEWADSVHYHITCFTTFAENRAAWYCYELFLEAFDPELRQPRFYTVST